MSEFPELFVLRHGQTEWNKLGRHQGRLDSELTSQGRVQAHAQSQILSELLGARTGFAAYCSPQGRARKTAEIALESIETAIHHDPRLCEICFGDWQGLTFDEIATGWPERTKYADQDMFAWHFRAPGGESFVEIYQRCFEFLHQLGAPSVVVTHGITSRILRGIWLGLGFDELAALDGGQGCVYHLRNKTQRRLPPL